MPDRAKAKKDAAVPTLQQLQERLGYQFRDPALLERALTHSSRAHELNPDSAENPVEHNESMEFLGDALLGAVVAASLYGSYPQQREGRLTRMRAVLVSRKALAACAQRISLGAHIRLGKGEDKSGGRHKSALLADTVEAVIAAIYLDGGGDAVRPVVERLLIPAASELLDATTEPDSKSALQEWFQRQKIAKPDYVLLSTDGPEHDKCFTIMMPLPATEYMAANEVRGVGRSKKQAEQECARNALQYLEDHGGTA